MTEERSEKMPAQRVRRPLWRRPGLLSLLLVFAWAAWAGVELGRGALAGREGAELARSAASAAGEGALTDPAPIEQLRRAGSRFDAANRSLGSPPLRAAGFVPVIGRQVREIRSLGAGASQLADVSGDTLVAAQSALAAERSTGPQRVAVLRRLAEIAEEGERRTAAIPRTKGEALFGPVAEQHDEFFGEVDRARSTLARAAAGAKATADLLGGPRRYLVLASNNAEMRAGSGMFNSVGLLETAGGKLTLQSFTPASDLQLPPPGAPISGDFADRWGWLAPGQEWRNLAVSPRFDQTAPLAATMWETAGRGAVDGVLAVDPLFLKAVLEAVGPVDVGGRTLDSSNVVRHILHDQYVAFRDESSDQSARREELGLVAGAVLGALETRSWDPGKLGRAVASVAQERHILAWSSRAEEQQGWEAVGIDGALGSDSMMLSVLNRGGNKLDQFLAVKASLACARSAGKVEGALTVHLRNDVPVGEPSYVAGPHPDSGVGEGVYLGILAVTLPGDAVSGRMDGVSQLAVAGPDGPTRVVAAEVNLTRGEERTYVVRFDLPADGEDVVVEATARVPAVQWDANGATWTTRPRIVACGGLFT